MKFHDGSTVTADDVMLSYNRILESGAGYNAGITKRLLIEGGMRKEDNLTFSISLNGAVQRDAHRAVNSLQRQRHG